MWIEVNLVQKFNCEIISRFSSPKVICEIKYGKSMEENTMK